MGDEFPTDSATRRDWKRHRRAIQTLGLIGFVGAVVRAVVRGDDGVFGFLGIALVVTLFALPILLWFFRRATRYQAFVRERRAGALFAGIAVLYDPVRLGSVAVTRGAFERFRPPWWERSADVTGLNGVLYVVSDKLGCELGWDPGSLARRCRVRDFWISTSEVARVEVEQQGHLGRAAGLRITLSSGDPIDFMVSDGAHLLSALRATPLPRP
jgi:hypothetical protein